MHTTPPSLMERLRESADPHAWRRFVKLYSPLLYFWAQRTGFQAGEADDLVQEVFTHLLQEFPKFRYDQEKSFRGWLRTVALNRWKEIQRRRKVATHSLEMDVVDRKERDPGEILENQESQQVLFRQALELMQTDFPGKTWRACWDVVAEGKDAAQVARELEMTVGAVHAARFRVLARLRHELAGFEN